MDDVKIAVLKITYGLSRKRNPCPVTDQRNCIDARKAYHREVKAAVIAARVKRRCHAGASKLGIDDMSVICNGISHSVNKRRKRVIYKTYIKFIHSGYIIPLIKKFYMDMRLKHHEVFDCLKQNHQCILLFNEVCNKYKIQQYEHAVNDYGKVHKVRDKLISSFFPCQTLFFQNILKKLNGIYDI